MRKEKRRGRRGRWWLRLMAMMWGMYRAAPILLVMLGLLYQMVSPSPAEGWPQLVWSILRRR